MTVVLHLLSISHGIAASLACFLVLQVAGICVLPARWRSMPYRGATVAVFGAAAYTIVCWFGIRANVPLGSLALAFAMLALLAGMVRRRHVFVVLGDWMTRAGLEWLALFVALYTLAYLFTFPPVSSDHLPLAWLGNVDVLQYLVYAKHLQRLGPGALPGISADSYVYLQTPGAFALLGGFSLFFGGDPMRATMPAIFALAALTGTAAGAFAARAFRLSTAYAGLLAAVVTSGPFFRFIAGHYYLSTLMAMPVVIHLLFTTVATGGGRERRPRGLEVEGLAFLALSCFAHDVVLLFTYPYLLAVALGFQVAALALVTSTRWQDGARVAHAVRDTAGSALAVAFALAAVCVVLPGRVAWVATMLRVLSETGRWGWALDVIAPSALLGLPLPMNRLGVMAPSLRPWMIGGLVVLGSAPFILFAGRFRGRLSRDERVLVGLCGVGFLLYAAYFSLVGPSYQQWKLASYVALPFSFAAVGVVMRVARPLPRLTTVIAVLIVAGNVAVHAVADPAFLRLPGALKNLVGVNDLPFRHLSLGPSDSLEQLLVAYFIPGKRISEWTPVPVPAPTAPSAPATGYEVISPAQPLLVPSFSCEGVGHDDTRTIEGVGCLLFEPPSLVLGAEYGFNRTFMFVEPVGLGRREDWGRWNTRPVVGLRLTADQRRIRLDDAAWLNLEVQRRRDDACEEPIRVAWGAGRRGEVVLGEREWISLPLRVGDWAGERVATQTVSLALPGTVGFLGLSVTPSPRGRTVGPPR